MPRADKPAKTRQAPPLKSLALVFTPVSSFTPFITATLPKVFILAPS